MRTSVLYTVLGIALVIGSACKGPDAIATDTDLYAGVARGANVVPLPADTTPRGSATFNTATLGYSYNVSLAPSGTIDSIALYQVAAGTVLPTNATVIFCAGAAACAATSGTATLVGTATAASVKTSMRGYGTQLVFFTTTAQKAAGGAMRGTMYAVLQ